MSLMGVVDLEIGRELGCKILNRTAVPSLQKPASEDAKPHLNLIEPGSMFGRKVEDMLMAWIAQECSALPPLAAVLGHKGHLAPLRHHTADVKAPVGVEILHHPVIPVHGWQLLDGMDEMGGDIGTGAGLAQMPNDLTRRDDKRGDQRSCAMSDVLVLAFFRFARCQRLRGVFALQNLHPGLFIAAEDQTALLKETQGIDV
jgi:hypothetical protein